MTAHRFARLNLSLCIRFAFGFGFIQSERVEFGQPLIVTTPKLLVSISPQQGFLHQLTELDTLGLDRPETKCKAYAK